MMNSAPAVVGASDGLAAFSRSSRKGDPLLLGRGVRRCGLAESDLYHAWLEGHMLFLS